VENKVEFESQHAEAVDSSKEEASTTETVADTDKVSEMNRHL
jgi:hypothetical protein